MVVTLAQQYATVTIKVSKEREMTVQAELLELEQDVATFSYRVPIGIAVFDIPVQDIVRIQLNSFDVETRRKGLKEVTLEQLQIHYTNMFIIQQFRKN